MQQAKFQIGQIIDHKLFSYRGVIFEVDPIFSHTNEWYEQVAKSKPPKDEPWYQVLVDNSLQLTYVAEQNLKASEDTSEITHPAIEIFFKTYKDGCYQPKQTKM